jgi:hypothetical protein
MLTPQAIQGMQFVFNVSFFFFRIELETKMHGFRYFGVFLGNAVKAYCDWVMNFRTSLIFGVADLRYESFYLQFLKPRLKLTFGYMQNWHSYLD